MARDPGCFFNESLGLISIGKVEKAFDGVRSLLDVWILEDLFEELLMEVVAR